MSNFSINVRVYYEDTDAGGIVYHANYFKFTERARTEWIRRFGIIQQDLLEKKEGFVVSKLSANFKKSAVLDDILTITCTPVKLRKASISFYQQVLNENGELLFDLTCDIAYVDLNKGSVKAMSKDLIQLIEKEIVVD